MSPGFLSHSRLVATKRNLTADTSCLMKIDLSHGHKPHPQFTNIVKEKVRALAVNSVGLGPPVYSVCRRKPDGRGRYSEVSLERSLHRRLTFCTCTFLVEFRGSRIKRLFIPT